MAKKKKKIETSKKILLVSYIITIILTIVVIIGSILGFDTSNITTITCLAYAEISASNIWYYKKSKTENAIKIIKDMPEEIRNQIDINQLMNQ